MPLYNSAEPLTLPPSSPNTSNSELTAAVFLKSQRAGRQIRRDNQARIYPDQGIYVCPAPPPPTLPPSFKPLLETYLFIPMFLGFWNGEARRGKATLGQANTRLLVSSTRPTTWTRSRLANIFMSSRMGRSRRSDRRREAGDGRVYTGLRAYSLSRAINGCDDES
ncbi:uncharacterized protein BJX67DRAFT_315659 [Aspergillus lucknowensis]|uniref:Uncharacterized protein n=1 Tax=Aspergillus lucknowensis TaxID=176173 RepID=A0ABR4LCI7_9EURO